MQMPDNNVGCGCPSESRNCGNGFGLFNGCGCDSEILFFIIIFLLLFTNFGCCGCGR